MKRREFLTLSIKAAMAAGFTGAIPAALLKPNIAHAALLAAGLSDPAAQPLFTNMAPNMLSDANKFKPKYNKIRVTMAQAMQMTGLVGADGVTQVPTTIWGYGENGKGVSWPGKSFERHIKDDAIEVKWENKLLDAAGNPLPHLLPVDTSIHWCYSLHGYQQYSIAQNGVPCVPHMHGGKNDSLFDGNPEYFFSPGWGVVGPRWLEKKYIYGGSNWNDVAGMMWYHDHAIGITRLNVYAGLAGLFCLRDNNDTGSLGNPAGLPAQAYELGYVVQDRMFRHTGELFYPAYPGDPFYADFIDGEGVVLPAEFVNGGPTALAEFFGDHMLVNGVIWPKASVEPRQYRLRLLNGTDSRFMRLKFKVIAGGASNAAATDPAAGTALPFYIVGSDQSLSDKARQVTEVDFLPAERLDLVIDFKDVPFGSRVIVENVFGDAPYGGTLPVPADLFPDRRTDRVMAFDVELPLDSTVPDTSVGTSTVFNSTYKVKARVKRTRKLGVYEGSDNFGRIQPLVGTAEPVVDVTGATVNGAMPWFTPVTEHPEVGDTEIWEIYNTTEDAHPIHVHLVYFEVLNREGFTGDVIQQPLLQHDGTYGVGYRLENIVTDGIIRQPYGAECSRRDMVIVHPGEVVRIKMTFEKQGRFVWHCHILSHEDHEMMRPFHVGSGPF